MLAADALQLLHDKIEEHGLADAGWSGKFDGARKRFGCCDYGKKEISLSKALVDLNPESEVLDTVLHEIAHALAEIEHGECCGHDQRWKAICTRIGARPQACYDNEDVVSPASPWHLVHQDTDEVFAGFERKPELDPSQTWIRGQKNETLGKLELRANTAMQIESFNRTLVSQLSEEVLAAVRGVIESRRIEVTMDCSYNESECKIEFSFRPEVPEGTDRELTRFMENAFIFGLGEEDYHKVIRSNGKSYVLCGIKPNNRKYPIIALCPRTGKRYKFPYDVLETLQDM